MLEVYNRQPYCQPNRQDKHELNRKLDLTKLNCFLLPQNLTELYFPLLDVSKKSQKCPKTSLKLPLAFGTP
jgi:hypothetical protein